VAKFPDRPEAEKTAGGHNYALLSRSKNGIGLQPKHSGGLMSDPVQIHPPLPEPLGSVKLLLCHGKSA
jgi:hypothetical protein